jgi:tetratricopeptide (TPR) repeat protein
VRRLRFGRQEPDVAVMGQRIFCCCNLSDGFWIFWNWRYVETYSAIQDANEASANGHYDLASLALNVAATKLPEAAEIPVMASYYRALDMMTRENYPEAIAAFGKCKALPPEYNVHIYLADAMASNAFEQKNYQGFLDYSKESLGYANNDPFCLAAVASAYACLYADKGADSLKTNALDYLAQAAAIDSTSAEAKEYRNRIEHRLATRQIIERETFIKQYPNGWKP